MRSPPSRSRSRSRSRSASPPRREHSSSRDMWRPSPPMGRDGSNRSGGDVHSVQQSYGMQSYEMSAPSMYQEGNYNSSVPAGPPPASYDANTNNYHSGYQQYGYDIGNYHSGYQQQQQQTYSGDYNAQQSGWQDNSMIYPDMSQPPPVSIQSATSSSSVNMRSSQASSQPCGGPPPVDIQKAEEAKKEAIQHELMQQKQTLAKQREEYVKKAVVIARELNLLKDQEAELLREDSRDSKATRILKENHKLQLEIQNKLKAINNVIDMLTGIIGDEKDVVFKAVQREESKAAKKRAKSPSSSPPRRSASESDSDSDSSPERDSRKSKAQDDRKDSKQSPAVPPPPPISHAGSSDRQVYNYVYYDPEMHWCRVCNVFPRTAKEFLNHLHSSEHKKETLERKLVDMPWHNKQSEEESPSYKNAPNRRTPIRGLQFFISVTAWYCKLCNAWIGDLHCASLHLKSKTHGDNYASFTEQNPHWETDWLADRERAYERRSEDQRRRGGGASVMQGESMTDQLPLALHGSSKAAAAVAEEKSSSHHHRHHKEHRKKDKKKSKGGGDEDVAVLGPAAAADKKAKKKRKKQRKKQRKGRKPRDSSDSSSSSTSTSSSTSSSSEDEEEEDEEGGGGGRFVKARDVSAGVTSATVAGGLPFDRTKSIRIAMRSKDKLSMLHHIAAVAAEGRSASSEAAIAAAQASKWESPPPAPPPPQADNKDHESRETAKEAHAKASSAASLAGKASSANGGMTLVSSVDDDKLLKEWAAPLRDVVSEGERQLLNNIKERVKQKQEAEKERDRGALAAQAGQAAAAQAAAAAASAAAAAQAEKELAAREKEAARAERERDRERERGERERDRDRERERGERGERGERERGERDRGERERERYAHYGGGGYYEDRRRGGRMRARGSESPPTGYYPRRGRGRGGDRRWGGRPFDPRHGGRDSSDRYSGDRYYERRRGSPPPPPPPPERGEREREREKRRQAVFD